jgi:hypothetical protein
MAALTATYVLASTSWLSHLAFATACWPSILAMCLVEYDVVSSFTRGRLRCLLKQVHFYSDKAAFFDLPSLVIDIEYNNCTTVRGITTNILDCSIQLHGIQVGGHPVVWSSHSGQCTNMIAGLKMGSFRELSMHSDAVPIKLFCQAITDDIYGVHWFASGPNNAGQS